jgi:hypothetical protein
VPEVADGSRVRGLFPGGPGSLTALPEGVVLTNLSFRRMLTLGSCPRQTCPICQKGHAADPPTPSSSPRRTSDGCSQNTGIELSACVVKDSFRTTSTIPLNPDGDATRGLLDSNNSIGYSNVSQQTIGLGNFEIRLRNTDGRFVQRVPRTVFYH